MEKPSNRKIALKGWYIVNLPVSIVIIVSWYLLLNFIGLQQIQLTSIIAVSIGWIYWELSIPYWIRWALKEGVNKEELVRIGKRNLLVWNSQKIDTIANKINR